jgi:ABC-type antimicrobial peptide transport system permease subunit
VIGLIAAILAGFACAAVAKNSKAPLVLAGIVLVLGLLFAIPALTSTKDPVRDSSVGNLEAMQSAIQPGWIHLLNPFIGAVCVVIGARLKGAKPS